ncbi:MULTISPECIES: hypothetical protein [unclassified Arthrobacter]|uniref:hypothetical protein n=1 Tax=unclassified Arthrobacter TaxID=235627 RepID=UPI001CFFBBCA|nr:MULTISPECIES: hypothetical protein [unclassified Arthrobacter]MCB5281404.1 hypothetical protein [Arthrobacter sp. ES1]WGZ80103.1 hypothetical protein QI450_02345 [Arthrobacter sp. EM1]
MNELRVDDRFSRALEEELVSRVRRVSPASARKRIRCGWGLGFWPVLAFWAGSELPRYGALSAAPLDEDGWLQPNNLPKVKNC